MPLNVSMPIASYSVINWSLVWSIPFEMYRVLGPSKRYGSLWKRLPKFGIGRNQFQI